MLIFFSQWGIWPFLAWLLFLLEDLKSHCLYWCGLSPLCDLLATLLLPLDQVVPVLHQGGQLALTFGKCQHRLLFGPKASSLLLSTKLPPSPCLEKKKKKGANDPLLPLEPDELPTERELVSGLGVTIIDTTGLPLDTSLWSLHRFLHDLDHLDSRLMSRKGKSRC